MGDNENTRDRLGRGGEGNERNVHEQLLIGVTIELGLVVQSFGPGFLHNGSAGFRSRFYSVHQSELAMGSMPLYFQLKNKYR